MVIQTSKTANVQYSGWVRQPAKVTPPEIDEHYFEKMAAFGLACLAAAIVGQLVMTSLSPTQPSIHQSK